MKIYITILTLFLCMACQKKDLEKKKFKNQKLMFQDSGTKNWQDKWTLDGLKATVVNTELGMEFKAGKEYGNDSCHAVLWTKKIFKGNFRMNYQYTRTDTVTRCVNILYLLATGRGSEDYPKDIFKWKEKRKEPKMRIYFKNMNTYHISYAAFAAKKFSGNNDYIRMRKYNPNKEGLVNTDIKPDYLKTNLFKPFTKYNIEVIKKDLIIEMNITDVKRPTNNLKCKWDISHLENLKLGRIGIRHMYTRSAIYKNIEIWQLD